MVEGKGTLLEAMLPREVAFFTKALCLFSVITQGNPSKHLFPPTIYSQQAFRWAFATVRRLCFRITPTHAPTTTAAAAGERCVHLVPACVEGFNYSATDGEGALGGGEGGQGGESDELCLLPVADLLTPAEQRGSGGGGKGGVNVALELCGGEGGDGRGDGVCMVRAVADVSPGQPLVAQLHAPLPTAQLLLSLGAVLGGGGGGKVQLVMQVSAQAMAAAETFLAHAQQKAEEAAPDAKHFSWRSCLFPMLQSLCAACHSGSSVVEAPLDNFDFTFYLTTAQPLPPLLLALLRYCFLLPKLVGAAARTAAVKGAGRAQEALSLLAEHAKATQLAGKGLGSALLQPLPDNLELQVFGGLVCIASAC
jgi:hypothetical protein